jgi:hypothetical protein
MMLGDPAGAERLPPSGQSSVTIDEIFRRVAQRRLHALALCDASNRETLTDGAPRRLTFAEADRMVSAIAARLRHMDLPTDAVIGIQMPNVVEQVLTILGVLRAGMIAAPLPLLWRRADACAALARIGAKALVTCGRVGSVDYARHAMHVAGDVFSIRYVCGFGAALPDGVVSFEDLFVAADPEPSTPPDRDGQPAAHVALVTFEVGAGGIVPVARNHLELLAGGLGVLLESRLAQEAAVLSTLAPASFAGICLTLLPFVLRGGTLLLHQPFDPDVLASQWRTGPRCGALVLPAPVAFRLAEAGRFDADGPACVLAAWRAPERMAASDAWDVSETALIDVAVFGEAGLVATPRGPDGRPAPLPYGPITSPRGNPGAVLIAEMQQTARGTVALRGPMVPHQPFPPGAGGTDLPCLQIAPGGLLDTGYGCRLDAAAMSVTVTAPPDGIVSVGGYRLALAALQDALAGVECGATVEASPDPLLGQRLAGRADDRAGMRAALAAAGVNPLAVAAFDHRGETADREQLRAFA